MGVDTGVVMIRTVCSVRHKRSVNCWHIPAKMISYLKRALEGAILWCDIKISSVLHLLRTQNASTVGH